MKRSNGMRICCQAIIIIRLCSSSALSQNFITPGDLQDNLVKVGDTSTDVAYSYYHSINGTVSGDVKLGVTVTLYGAASAITTITDANGNYSFTNVAGGTYTLMPSLTGYTFTPATLSVTVVDKDFTGQNFTSKVVISWAKNAGGIDHDFAHSVAVDAAGNLYMAGQFSGDATFGSITLTSAGVRDAFLAKYDASGNCLWAVKAGGKDGDTTTDVAYSVAVDTAGNTYLAGRFSGIASFGSIILISAGGADAFLAKYDVSGNCLWAVKAGGDSTYAEYAHSVAVDAVGNIYLVGCFFGTATFGSLFLTSVSNSYGEVTFDAFLAKYDASGNCLWAVKAGGTNHDIAHSVAVDAAGNLYLAGRFDNDAFITKYDASGNCLWEKKAGGISHSNANSVAVDNVGNTYLGGYFNDRVYFDSIALNSAGGADAFLAKYDASGNCLWAKRAGSIDSDVAYSVAVDAAGNIYWAGNVCYGVPDAFLIKYDASGNYLWSQIDDNKATNVAYSVAVDAAGNTYLAGYFYYMLPFGLFTLTSTGGSDVFLAKYGTTSSVFYSISGSVFGDVKSGVAITLFEAASAITDANGNYSFTNLAGGTYTLIPSLAGYTFTPATLSITVVDKDITGQNFTAIANPISTYTVSGTISGDAKEGINIAVTGGASVKTNAAGAYKLTGLKTGIYTLTPSLTGYTFTPATLSVTVVDKDITGQNFVAGSMGNTNTKWAKNAGGLDYDVAFSVAVDAADNTYIAGSFSDTATFGSISLTSEGDRDAFLAKYDTAGNCLWAKNAGGSDYDVAFSVAVDAAGNIYIAGSFSDTATFGSISLTSGGDDDAFLAKYDTAGNCLWAKSFGGGLSESPMIGDQGSSVAVDGMGNVYLAGYHLNTTSLSIDAFLAKYDVTGNCLWVVSVDGTGTDKASSVAVDATGNVYLAGWFHGIASFGSISLTSIRSSSDAFLAKYDTAGNCLWAVSAGGSIIDEASSVAVDATGNIYLAGRFSYIANFDSISLTSEGDRDAFIAKYDADGKCLWAQRVGFESDDNACSVAVDSVGNAYLVGYFSNYAHSLFAKYDASGNCFWSLYSGGNAAYSVAVDSVGNVYLAGYFFRTANFDSGILTSNGQSDAYLAKYGTSLVFYSISGSVFGDVKSGVTVTLSGVASAITDANGKYTFTNMPRGTYTLTPSLANYTFTPAALIVTVVDKDITGQNFIAGTNKYTGKSSHKETYDATKDIYTWNDSWSENATILLSETPDWSLVTSNTVFMVGFFINGGSGIEFCLSDPGVKAKFNANGGKATYKYKLTGENKKKTTLTVSITWRGNRVSFKTSCKDPNGEFGNIIEGGEGSTFTEERWTGFVIMDENDDGLYVYGDALGTWNGKSETTEKEDGSYSYSWSASCK